MSGVVTFLPRRWTVERNRTIAIQEEGATIDRFLASEVAWMVDARCKGAVFDFVPNTESVKEMWEVRQAFCNLCPVRVECLAYALLYHLSGYWGGTDTAERRRLAVPRNRVKCPECRSTAVISTEERHEICQHCGVSWAGSRPRLPEEDCVPC